MLDISFVGRAFMCDDSTLNGPINISFSATGESSGGTTIISVNLGGDLGSFEVEIPKEQTDAIIAAVSASGGKLEQEIPQQHVGPSGAGCYIEGTLILSVEGSGQVGPNAPGNVVTSTAGLSNFLRTELPAISNRVGAAFRGAVTGFALSGNVYSVSGMAAGEGDRPPIGAWAGYSYTDSKNDFSSTAFSSDRHTFLFGLDTMPADNLLLGVSMSFERDDIDTHFNGGEQRTIGFSVTPYLGLLLNDWLMLDAAIGIGILSTDQFRLAGATRVSSDVDSTRIFGNVNATATWAFDKVLASGYAGMLYATQDDDDFLESNGTSIPDIRTNLGRFLLGGELAYAAGAWEPYVSGTFEYDYTRSTVDFAPGVAQPDYDASDVLFAVGLRYFGNNNVSGALEYNTVLGRNDLSEHSFNANLRWEF